ncbi:hypothetical protein PRBEI_2001424500 [Prionailurus iriomotensis]
MGRTVLDDPQGLFRQRREHELEERRKLYRSALLPHPDSSRPHSTLLPHPDSSRPHSTLLPHPDSSRLHSTLLPHPDSSRPHSTLLPHSDSSPPHPTALLPHPTPPDLAMQERATEGTAAESTPFW